MIIHLEPDIMECEDKWALRSIAINKASDDDKIPAELFKILKADAVKVLHSICQHTWKTQHWPQDWKKSAFIPIPKKGSAKECSNYPQLCSFHMLVRLYTKSFNEASAVCEPRTSRCTSWVWKRQRNQRSNCQHALDHRESKGIQNKPLLLLY